MTEIKIALDDIPDKEVREWHRRTTEQPKMDSLPAPSIIQIELTKNCNNACIMCHKGQVAPGRDFLRTDISEVVINQIRPIFPHLKYAMLFGDGEPMLYKNFWKIVADIRRESSNCAIDFINNGSLMNKIGIGNCLNYRISHIGLSMGGATAKTHNYIRKLSDLDNVVSNYRNLRKAKENKKTKEPYVSILVVVMKSNIEELSDLVELANSLGAIEVLCQQLFITHPSMNKEIVSSLIAEKHFKKASKKAKLLGIGFDHYPLDNGNSYRISVSDDKINRDDVFFTPKYTSVKPKVYCSAEQPWNTVYVLHDGTIVPDCHWWNSKRKRHLNACGKLSINTNILDIWHGNVYHEIRSNIDNGNILPQCRGCGLAGGVKKEFRCPDTDHIDPNQETSIVPHCAYKKSIYTVRTDQFAYLFETPLFQLFFDGYRRYSQDNHLTPENIYWQHLRQVATSPFVDSEYQSLSDEELKKLILSRFELIEKMKSGFDPVHPIRLFIMKYASSKRTIETDLDTKIDYHALDGYHRIIISHYHGIPKVYVTPANIVCNKYNLEHIMKRTNKNGWQWYQPIDFGNDSAIPFQNKDDNSHGVKKYEFALRKHLEPLRNRVVMDLGCNTGVVTAAIARSCPKLVVGIDKENKIKQTLFVKNMLWKDYANLSFCSLDLSDIKKFRKLCQSISPIDCILASNFIYYLGDMTDELIGVCYEFCPKIVLQGNTLKQQSGERVVRSIHDASYRGEYSQLEPMRELLSKHGYNVYSETFPNYTKPVVVGVRYD